VFSRILVANRGEIAVRVIRAAKELGIETVAIFSQADADSLHTKLADQAICVGPPAASLSYLNVPAIISAARVSGAEAVHPGYGFLAENASFAEVCGQSGLVFIGPPPSAMEAMGHKSTAKRTMRAAGVPVVPGSDGAVDEKNAASVAEAIGYPVIVKASSGGGGRGMRVVDDPKELANAVSTAQAEAGAAFGDAEVYLERYVDRPRHIEFQVMADSQGNVVHLGERDCSIQRRHQKLIEESPSVALSAGRREEMGRAAVEAARAIGYRSAGTVEFLLTPQDEFFFMEMNTRVQVEHPVTEMVTSRDIIKEQIRIAAGETLSFRQEDVAFLGHAIEFRINAEDPARGFMPCPGHIDLVVPPGGPGVRVDTHLYSGYTVPPFYDSLLAKLIVWGRDRDEAIARGRRALDEFIITGVPTTIPFHQGVLDNEFFRRGEVDTNFVARRVLSE
jgi:acetyl-CoA carboxylase, biotin carboxylase subunit